MDIFHALLILVALYYYWKHNKGQLIKPRQPQGCKCAGTCARCKDWKLWVRSEMLPCPGDEKWYYFDDWNGIWKPRAITHVDVGNMNMAKMTKLKKELEDTFKKIGDGNELYTLEKPPAKYK